jgi:alkanesulfonate monooxygenase SsuD/methylene tetrahydromethanopterin reductase-like flavin-dependent oxidoreductase (luciferase family)
MEIWQFCEQSMHPAWSSIQGPTKVTIPNEVCDPVVANDLYNRYLDEWMLGDDLGYNIFVNEHHASANCMSVSCTLTLAILARQTTKARLLALGVPIANRTDPYRVAEELAMIDVISKGRLEVGLVKASPFELSMSNQSPARIMDRYWEAHDFIVKAMKSREPFSWEGEFYHYRNVNLWPRPYQQPMPPMWITASSAGNGRKIAQLGYVCATFFNGKGTKVLFDAYREEYKKTHGRVAPPDRLAYLGMMVTGHNDAEVAERVAKMKCYLDVQPRTPPQWTNPPGYEALEGNVKALQAGKKAGRLNFGLPPNPTIEQMIDGGIFFAGTPDQLYNQIRKFSDSVGGVDHLLLLSQAGELTHADTVDSLTLFAKEVMPRLKELKSNHEVAPMAAE